MTAPAPTDHSHVHAQPWFCFSVACPTTRSIHPLMKTSHFDPLAEASGKPSCYPSVPLSCTHPSRITAYLTFCSVYVCIYIYVCVYAASRLPDGLETDKCHVMVSALLISLLARRLSLARIQFTGNLRHFHVNCMSKLPKTVKTDWQFLNCGILETAVCVCVFVCVCGDPGSMSCHTC